MVIVDDEAMIEVSVEVPPEAEVGPEAVIGAGNVIVLGVGVMDGVPVEEEVLARDLEAQRSVGIVCFFFFFPASHSIVSIWCQCSPLRFICSAFSHYPHSFHSSRAQSRMHICYTLFFYMTLTSP